MFIAKRLTLFSTRTVMSNLFLISTVSKVLITMRSNPCITDDFYYRIYECIVKSYWNYGLDKRIKRMFHPNFFCYKNVVLINWLVAYQTVFQRYFKILKWLFIVCFRFMIPSSISGMRGRLTNVLSIVCRQIRDKNLIFSKQYFA